jgi:hypothetical protein
MVLSIVDFGFFFFFFCFFAWNLQNKITIWHWTCHGTMLYDPKLIIIELLKPNTKCCPQPTSISNQILFTYLIPIPLTCNVSSSLYAKWQDKPPKKKSFFLCLVWGLRHRNMHKVILFVVKRTSLNFKYSFWKKHGWCWMNLIHIENVCVDGKWSN